MLNNHLTRILLAVCLVTLCSGQQGEPLSSDPSGRWELKGDRQRTESHVYHLDGNAEMRGLGGVFRADSIDYDELKGVVHLYGHAFMETAGGITRGEAIDYDLNSHVIRLKKKPVRN